MAQDGRRRGPPWLAFLAGALVVLIALGAYTLWRGGPSVDSQDIGVDIDLPSTPTLPLPPAPDPAPMPLPTPSPSPG